MKLAASKAHCNYSLLTSGAKREITKDLYFTSTLMLNIILIYFEKLRIIRGPKSYNALRN